MSRDCRSSCLLDCPLDCPYCHLHVVDLYGHLRWNPCQAAILAARQEEAS
jgi:hypothetical protein